MPDRPRNIGASVRQRLLNLAHARGQPMELLLTRYALERLLHRLSLSPHRERFVLKGAMPVELWSVSTHQLLHEHPPQHSYVGVDPKEGYPQTIRLLLSSLRTATWRAVGAGGHWKEISNVGKDHAAPA